MANEDQAQTLVDQGTFDTLFEGPQATPALQDTTVRDTGPFETGLTYAAARVSSLPLMGSVEEPLGKGARTVGKSIDQFLGLDTQPMADLVGEAVGTQAVDTPFVAEVKSNLAVEDTYQAARDQGYNSADSLGTLSLDSSTSELRQAKKLTRDKSDSLRWDNPELRSAMIEMFTAEPDTFADKVGSIGVASDYLSEWSLSNTPVLNMTGLLSAPNKLEYAQNAVINAHARGDITMEDSQDFIENYANITGNEAALFHATNVGIYSKRGDQYSNQIKLDKSRRLDGVDYATMPDKDFFKTYAEHPTLAKAGPELKEFTGEAEPLVFLQTPGVALPENSSALYDTVGMHVTMPTQESMAAQKESGASPVVLQKTVKITDALRFLGEDWGFDPDIEFSDNPKHMKNGVMTEAGMHHLTNMFGEDPISMNKSSAQAIRDVLKDEGVTYIPYTNRKEDVADLSVWVLDAEGVKPTQ